MTNLVLAHTIHEFRTWKRNQGQGVEGPRFITRPQDIAGLDPDQCKIYKTGYWYLNPLAQTSEYWAFDALVNKVEENRGDTIAV